MDDTFSIEYDIYRVVMSNEPNLATAEELDTIYSINGLFNFLEMLDFKEELMQISRDDLKAQQLAEKAQQGRQR